jgi:site-specific DNA-methyltransferase (adenine-specific)
MEKDPLPRLDRSPELREALLPFCRLKQGDIWIDPDGKHEVGCLDATSSQEISRMMGNRRSVLAIQDPPYNLVAFDTLAVAQYVAWCRKWVDVTAQCLQENSSLYVWLGADQTNGFQPLPDFMIMMRDTPFRTRSFITMRNQRGYGTQRNWMAVRQELLYYTLGQPPFNVEAEYTDIPKILRGYYKTVNGRKTENLERGKSENIRAGNLWVDIQQVFYRMEENVNGCYAQKPLKAIKRILQASSNPGDLVIDFFAHSGSTLLACELSKRCCLTVDVDPVYCEITIRRLEQYRRTGQTGWQNIHPFVEEARHDLTLQGLLGTTPRQELPLFS